MQTLIDYLSYTFYSAALRKAGISEIREALHSDLPSWIDRAALDNAMLVGTGIRRAGFDAGVSIDKHTFIFWTRTGLILIEHTGQGCERLRAIDAQDKLLRSTQYRFTRVDIAVDIETDARPTEFAAEREHNPTRAYGIQHSDTGETVYIGSKKSDRTCKVYRYNPPHPRSHLLRIEYTYRSEQANVITNLYREGKTVETLAYMSGVRYGWTHPAYADSGSTRTIKAWRPDNKQGKTLRWLLAQCAPALAKLIKANEISLQEFIDYVKGLMDDDDHDGQAQITVD